MEKTTRDPDEFLQSLPDGIRDDMITLDRAISAAMPRECREMWEGKFWGGSNQSIIGYGKYEYKRSGKKTANWFITGLALQKNYFSVYINAVEEGQYLSERDGPAIGKVRAGKSSISFKRLAEIDLAKLVALVQRGYQIMRPEPVDSVSNDAAVS